MLKRFASDCPSETRHQASAWKEYRLSPDTHSYADRLARGRTGEQIAAAHLAARGYRVLAINQRTPVGELDLVCRQGCQIVIVEVKARSTDEYGAALDAIGPRKVGRLRAAAKWWLAERGMLFCSIRFDAVLVSLDRWGQPCSLEHLTDLIGGGF